MRPIGLIGRIRPINLYDLRLSGLLTILPFVKGVPPIRRGGIYSPFRKGSTADSAGRDLFSLPKIPRLSVIRRLLRSLRSRVAGTPFTNGEWGVLRWPSEGGTYAHPAQFDTQFFWYNYIVLFIDFRITKRGYCLSGVEGHYFMAAPRLCSGNKI